jgi:prepilin-type processing-associated H-X9-DG protein
VYRHGKYPPVGDNEAFKPTGGAISFNILYGDGHAVKTTDRAEAYRSVRQRYPG